MKHEGLRFARQAAKWVGSPLAPEQESLLTAYAVWLVEEAAPAGALGPRETGRIWSRHIGDSLTLGAPWRGEGPPEEILDVGSGAGLPGIPLGILWPDCRVTLLDRAGRRVRLLRRAVRMLALPNVRVEQGDVFAVGDEWSGLVFRGSVTPPEAVGLAARLLSATGRAAVALTRKTQRPAHLDELIATVEMFGLVGEEVVVPPEVLDGPAWVLIIKSRGD